MTAIHPSILTLFIFVTGLIIGGLVSYLVLRGKFERKLAVLNERLNTKEQKNVEDRREIINLKTENITLQNHITELKVEHATLKTVLEKEQKTTEEKLTMLNEARVRLSDTFKALSSEALKSNNQTFLEVAKSSFEKLRSDADGDLLKRQTAIDQIIKPIAEGLTQFDTKIQALEKARIGAYEGLNQQVKHLIESQHLLRAETSNLVNALRTPQTRGRWGEIQLKRVVEIAGMLSHCDFQEQPVAADDSSMLRPDMIINLPGGKTLVVDAKVPLTAYLDGIESFDDAVKQKKNQEHARHIREHIRQLSRKSYWEQFPKAPEFVILFLAGEAFFSAALQEDPSLIEQGVSQRVIIATPTTLIALLKAVSYGWKQESLAENSKKIGELGKELYKRIADMSRHFGQLGSSLRKSVESYNRAVGTLESRVLVSARRFEELTASDTRTDVQNIPPIDTAARQLQAPEMQQQHDSE